MRINFNFHPSFVMINTRFNPLKKGFSLWNHIHSAAIKVILTPQYPTINRSNNTNASSLTRISLAHPSSFTLTYPIWGFCHLVIIKLSSAILLECMLKHLSQALISNAPIVEILLLSKILLIWKMTFTIIWEAWVFLPSNLPLF